jgi:hypothetical protein
LENISFNVLGYLKLCIVEQYAHATLQKGTAAFVQNSQVSMANK